MSTYYVQGTVQSMLSHCLIIWNFWTFPFQCSPSTNDVICDKEFEGYGVEVNAGIKSVVLNRCLKLLNISLLICKMGKSIVCLKVLV